MGIILKHTFKNIFSKPGRTFLLALCIFLCSLAASLCLDMTGSVQRLFANAFSNLVGSTDLEFVGYEPIDEEELTSLLPENNTLLCASTSTTFHRRDPQLYSYAVATVASVVAADLDKANEMRILTASPSLSENETAMTKELAKLLGYSVGDSVYFYDWDGEKVEFTIAELMESGGLMNNRNCCLISVDGMKRLSKNGEVQYFQAFIDILDNHRINEAEDILKERYPEAEMLNITNNEDTQDAIDQISQVFMMFFAVCLLVVIIITLTVSERIMSERMAVVGTLRSLGVSQTMTAFILMLENVIYALLGSIPAIAVYVLIRPAILDGLFSTSGNITPDFGEMTLPLKIGIVAGAVVVECACTLKEILRASRTSIRDIIFLNKDTEYRFSVPKTVLGLVALVGGVALFFVPRSYAALILCFVGTIVGVYLLFPYVTVFVSRLLEGLFEKLSMPVARLAAAETGSKKSTIASTQLIAAAAGITVLLFIIADSMYAMTSAHAFEGDVVVQGAAAEDYMYDYIDDLEGVTATENVYVYMYTISEINGVEVKNYTTFGYDGQDMFKAVRGLPEEIGCDEFCMDKNFAENNGIKIGDSVEFMMNTDSFIPRPMTLRLAGYCDSSLFDGRGKSIVLNKERFIEMYSDSPAYIIARTDGTNDEKIVDMIGKYSSSTISEVQTIKDFNEQLDKESALETQVIKLVGFLGIILTFIGVVSNQLIGFESRRRECAVLAAVAMEKKTLKKMLFLETVFSCAVSLLCAVPVGIFAALPILGIMELLEVSMPVVISGAELFAVAAGLLVFFAATVLFPFGKLGKMKLAEQLKYE